MRRLFIMVVSLLVCAVSMRANADDAQDWRRHDEHRALKVFDAKGKLVGRLAEFGGADGVYLNIDGALVFASLTWLQISTENVDSARYQWSTFGPYNYTTTDCSGAPIISPGSGPRPSIAVRSGSDVTLLIAGDTLSSPVRIVAIFDGTNCTPPPYVNHMPPSMAPVPSFAVETRYPLSARHPEPLTIGY
jgi:hypothetical protein